MAPPLRTSCSLSNIIPPCPSCHQIDTGFIVVDARGESRDGDNGWVSFFAALPPQEPRYAVYDHHFMSQDGHLYNKLVFVLWSPDEASTRLKMTYAAAKVGHAPL